MRISAGLTCAGLTCGVPIFVAPACAMPTCAEAALKARVSVYDVRAHRHPIELRPVWARPRAPRTPRGHGGPT